MDVVIRDLGGATTRYYLLHVTMLTARSQAVERQGVGHKYWYRHFLPVFPYSLAHNIHSLCAPA
jgi:hypothetical protein